MSIWGELKNLGRWMKRQPKQIEKVAKQADKLPDKAGELVGEMIGGSLGGVVGSILAGLGHDQLGKARAKLEGYAGGQVDDLLAGLRDRKRAYRIDEHTVLYGIAVSEADGPATIISKLSEFCSDIPEVMAEVAIHNRRG